MTPSEIFAWELHLIRYPPIEHILSKIWLMLKGEKADVEEVGYWLESPQGRAAREEEEKSERRKAEARATKEAYQSSEEAKK